MTLLLFALGVGMYAAHDRIDILAARVVELEEAEDATAKLKGRIRGGNVTIGELAASCVAMARHIEGNERLISNGLTDSGRGPATGIGGD